MLSIPYFFFDFVYFVVIGYQLWQLKIIYQVILPTGLLVTYTVSGGDVAYHHIQWI